MEKYNYISFYTLMPKDTKHTKTRHTLEHGQTEEAKSANHDLTQTSYKDRQNRIGKRDKRTGELRRKERVDSRNKQKDSPVFTIIKTYC